MEVAVSGRVIARNGIGQFIRECEMAGEATVADLVREGKALSLEFAPVGHKPDPRTPTLQGGMYSHSAGTTGYWGCRARHALAIEYGAGAHLITGRVHFFWEAMGRYWTPGSNMIHHPGNAAQPYLRPAYKIVSGRAMAVARKYYP